MLKIFRPFYSTVAYNRWLRYKQFGKLTSFPMHSLTAFLQQVHPERSFYIAALLQKLASEIKSQNAAKKSVIHDNKCYYGFLLSPIHDQVLTFISHCLEPSGQSLSPEDEKENGREKEEAKLETGNGDEEMKVEIESPEKEADSGIEKSEPSEVLSSILFQKLAF